MIRQINIDGMNVISEVYILSTLFNVLVRYKTFKLYLPVVLIRSYT